jgi:uncharacterized protein (TIGR01777 family)
VASSLSVLIAGGTGLIGRELTAQLEGAGHVVHTLTRSAEIAATESRTYVWNPGVTPLNLDALGTFDAIINLAGSSISQMPWTAKRRAGIMHSRLASTNTLTEAIATSTRPPLVLLSGSAVGFYGNRGEETLTEVSPRGTGFLPDVVVAWEAAAKATPEGVRVVLLRTGLVLSPTGGALGPLRLLTKMGVAGPLAGGKSWWPWISLRDEVRAIMHLLTSEVWGPVNLVGPESERSATVMQTLAQRLKRPFWLPAPGFAITALLGQAGKELLLSSQRIQPTVLLADGFSFLDDTVASAIAQTEPHAKK